MANVGHAVQILQSQNNRGTDRPDDVLTLAVAVQTAPGLDEVGHTSTLAVLHDDPHLSVVQPLRRRLDEAFKVSHNEGRVAPTQNVNLAHNFVGLGVVLPIAVAAVVHLGDDFDGHDGIGLLVPGTVHRTERSLAEEGQNFQSIGPIGGRVDAPQARC